jgi:predicted  nucleic acid-binding Zn-ribbon protein
MSTNLAGWDSVCGALADIRASHGEFGKFFSEVFDQLTVMTSQLAARQEHLVQAAEEHGSQDGAQVSARGEQLCQQVQQLLEEALQERAEQRESQEAVRTQLTRLATVAAELAGAQTVWGDVRNEVSTLRSDIRQQFEQVQALQGQPADQDAYRALQQQMQQMVQQQATVEQERKGLEAELEAVRGRAAELADALAEQKRQLAQQQAAWTEEFKRIRLLLEVMGGRLSEGIHAINPAKPEPARKVAPAAAVAAGDPVLESVMAQFEILQKDVARRRAAT